MCKQIMYEMLMNQLILIFTFKLLYDPFWASFICWVGVPKYVRTEALPWEIRGFELNNVPSDWLILGEESVPPMQREAVNDVNGRTILTGEFRNS